jgi:hypothetical protein
LFKYCLLTERLLVAKGRHRMHRSEPSWYLIPRRRLPWEMVISKLRGLGRLQFSHFFAAISLERLRQARN